MNIVKSDILIKIKELLEGIYRYNIKSKYSNLLPRSLMINLTYKCNSRCVMCNIWRMKPKNEVNIKGWKKIMKDKIFSDIRNLTISGGEPLLYKDFINAIKLFVDSMSKLRRLVLNTNGFMPERVEKEIFELAKFCKNKGIKFVVNVSIDGVEEVHNGIRRIENGFSKSTETVRRIKKISKKYHINVGVSCVLLRQNISKYKEMEEWLTKSKNKGSYQIVGFLNTFLNNIESKKDLDINTKVKHDFLNVLSDIRDNCGIYNPMKYYWEDMLAMYGDGTIRSTPCPFLIDDFVIDGLGDVYYCLSTNPIGNFIKEKRSVGDIYFDLKNIRLRKKFPGGVCQKCNSGCNVVNGLAFDFKKYLWYKITGRLWMGKNI